MTGRKSFLRRLLPRFEFRKFSLQGFDTVDQYRFPWETQWPDFSAQHHVKPSTIDPPEAFQPGIIEPRVSVAKVAEVTRVAETLPADAPDEDTVTRQASTPGSLDPALEQTEWESKGPSQSLIEPAASRSEIADPTNPSTPPADTAEDTTTRPDIAAAEAQPNPLPTGSTGTPSSQDPRRPDAAKSPVSHPAVPTSESTTFLATREEEESAATLALDEALMFSAPSSQTEHQGEFIRPLLSTHSGSGISFRVEIESCVHGQMSKDEPTPASLFVIRLAVTGKLRAGGWLKEMSLDCVFDEMEDTPPDKERAGFAIEDIFPDGSWSIRQESGRGEAATEPTKHRPPSVRSWRQYIWPRMQPTKATWEFDFGDSVSHTPQDNSLRVAVLLRRKTSAPFRLLFSGKGNISTDSGSVLTVATASGDKWPMAISPSSGNVGESRLTFTESDLKNSFSQLKLGIPPGKGIWWYTQHERATPWTAPNLGKAAGTSSRAPWL
ncbi:hypothetical protein QBC34DRAFT_144906 [Podospora aff. communis PSN243]|uniref:Uncharacterized protein n=1 Tax=Podospora aff. communis PSN243 TaxID=3040156 RepID=A0AAV9GH00_9PEZI|nr:hypothetical protein QBC34DRAFT_144906 [Podospora aff. communis PSN243]